MSILNEVWTFIVSFRDDKQWLPLPCRVQEELVAAFFLSPFSYMNFRLPINPTVTASDASETGGGLTASEGLTDWGVKVSRASGRGDSFESFNEQGLLVISLFDGIGALRVALENLKVPLAGYVAVEKDEKASRVVESHFPSCTFCTDVNAISAADIRAWGAKYPNCRAVLVAGGPPCQGVSGLNAAKKGASEDPRSSLHKAFDQIKKEEGKFLTFTTAQPMKQPRFRPAGLETATQEDKERWTLDRFRFPPYQYSYSNGVIHSRKGWRMLEVEEKELMLGFPMHFTLQCKGKGYRNSFPQDTEDIRMTLLGNRTVQPHQSVENRGNTLVLGLIPVQSVFSIMDRLKPGNSSEVTSLLLRESFRRPAAFVAVSQTQEDQERLDALVKLLSYECFATKEATAAGVAMYFNQGGQAPKTARGLLVEALLREARCEERPRGGTEDSGALGWNWKWLQ
eukprot:s1447_g16.t1